MIAVSNSTPLIALAKIDDFIIGIGIRDRIFS